MPRADPPPGPFRDNPTVEEVREGIATQVCPWCGAGPFRSLSRHTMHMHEVSVHELRERAFLYKWSSVCSPELRELRQDISRERYEGHGYAEGFGDPEALRGPRDLSEAAKALQAEKARSQSPESRKRGVEAGRRTRAEKMLPVYELAGRTYDQVRRELGREYGAVTETAKRLGEPEPRMRRRLKVAASLDLCSYQETEGDHDE